MDHEFLTVVDNNDVVLGYSTKADIKRRGLNCRCVQVFLFNASGELLICRRPSDKKKFPNQYASVMGYVRRGETYEDAAKREVKEELGTLSRLSRITKFSIVDGGSRLFQEIYSGSVSGELTLDKTEISETKYASIRDLRSDMVSNLNKYAPPFIEALRAYMKSKNIY
ncbi:MAG: NUDIX domain-containing protein [Candidatus Woesearchaeota archaeon]